MKQIFYAIWCAGFFAAFAVMGAVMAEEPVVAHEQIAPQQDEGVAAADAAPEPAAIFDVMEYRVEGNSVLPAVAVERVLYPHLGQGRNIEDVEKARADLERSYREAGYPTVLVDIPEQDVSASVVRLRVTEGRVDKVRVIGARYYSQGRILEKFPALTQGKVLYLPDVQKGLAEVNRSAGRRVTPILRPGKTPGTVEIDFRVDDTLPLHAALELNNRYSANTSQLRLSGMVRYDNLWQKEHGLTLQYQTSPENTNEVSVLSISYLLPVANSTNMLALYAVRSRSEVAAVGDIQVLGDGDIYGARAILPLPQQGRYFHSLSLGVDYKDFKETVVLRGADSTINTPISYLPFSVQYNATLQGTRGITQADVGVNFSLRGVADETVDCFGQQVNEFECKRFKARASYVYLKGSLQRVQRLPLSMSVVGRIGGQLTDQPLISNEQMGAGGVDSVRGYLEFERTGDYGVYGSLELRRAFTTQGNAQGFEDMNFFGFIEGAKLRVMEALPGQTSRFDLSSAGVGARLKWRDVSATLNVAVPFEATLYTPANEVRTHFKLVYEF